jgi:hypothetical protein
MDADIPVVFVLRHVESRTCPGPAGVVDQNVDTAKGLVGLIHESAHLSDIRHVGRHDHRFAVQRFDLAFSDWISSWRGPGCFAKTT